MGPPAADDPHPPDANGGSANRDRATATPPGSISVGGSVSGGVLSTGPHTHISYGVPEPADPAHLLAAITALRAALLTTTDPGPPGNDPDHTDLDTELTLAQEELQRHGTLAANRRQALRERLDIITAATAGGASLATLAQTVTGLLT
ncbi:hypothetical protein ACH4FX_42545 [Streptomyces sp. NPDC018019]|uniref:hypothetical protein n=1 Tax=Streptomyces sp. NPDC018019 TaxID=3365030 RepID=UPI003796A715